MYPTMCTYLAPTILEMDREGILWRNQKKLQFSNSIVKKKRNFRSYYEEPYSAINP